MIRATVRLQLHAGFTLDAAGAQLDYYDALGISHLYLSPVARARCGSTHGYDVIDHAQVNPELGGLAALRRLAGAARARGMGLILDIVPNHMAAHPDNRWWREVLRDGPASAYADWFDIDWRPPGRTLRGRVLLPVLTCGARAALASGEIGLRAGSDGTPALHANGLDLPLAPASLPMAALLLHHGGTPAQWHALLRAQAYRLAWWRSAAQAINWRRFFEIGDLVGVRVERPEVFDAVHALPLALYRAGLIDGLRIDHVDGLAEPGAYCRRLRAELAQAGQARAARGLSAEPYVVVEKILGDKETLRTDWPVQGTTGYDFMNEASAWLHDARGAAPLAAFWRDNAGTWPHWREQLRRIRLRLLRRHFGAERRALARSLADLPELRASAAAIDPVLTQWLACFPVYRTYAEGGAGQAADQAWRQTAQTRANAHLDPAQQALLAALCLALDGRMADAPHRLALRRLQQLTPPLAAKALEDTWFYRDGTLLSRNEVGPAPAQFALGGGALRRSVAARAPPSASLAGHRQPRPQARRGRARAPGGAERNAATMVRLGPAMAGRRRRQRRPARLGRPLHAAADPGGRLARRPRARRPGRHGRAVAARGRLAGQGPTRSQAAQQLDLSRPGLRNLVRALSARPGRRWRGAARRRRPGAPAGAGRTGQQPGPDRAAAGPARRAGSIPRL